MCTTCGCSNTNTKNHHESKLIQKVQDVHEKALNIDILNHNDQIAQHNREHFERDDVFCLNLVSSPGSGKTTWLVDILNRLQKNYSETDLHVIEGDQATENDANRIRSTGVEACQVNTGTGCHLDAEMIHQALHQLKPKRGDLVFIENVGNLVCPALFDLGEKMKVVFLSVCEGEDKALKYPHMFKAADVLIITKIDLLPHLDVDIDLAINYAKQVNPTLKIHQVSTKTGAGMAECLTSLIPFEVPVNTP